MKVDMEFKEVLRNAEQERKLKKYFEQKEKDARTNEEKRATMLEKMAKKQAVERPPGKMQMVRMNVPSHETIVATKKKVKTDWDMVKYFGEDVDWAAMQEEADKQEENKLNATLGKTKDFEKAE